MCFVIVVLEETFPREVETFERRGFVPVTLGPAILRTEQAVAVLLGQLALLERL